MKSPPKNHHLTSFSAIHSHYVSTISIQTNTFTKNLYIYKENTDSNTDLIQDSNTRSRRDTHHPTSLKNRTQIHTKNRCYTHTIKYIIEESNPHTHEEIHDRIIEPKIGKILIILLGELMHEGGVSVKKTNITTKRIDVTKATSLATYPVEDERREK